MKDPNENRKGYKKTKVGWIPKGWSYDVIGNLALVQTGIAKGKSVKEDPVEMPYLRVANVQDGRVVLDEIKTITVSRLDVDRYRLRDGDVLFTEGGDFDKLGRGCVWNAEIDPCLHQNHVFAVRCRQDVLMPSLLACHASASHGRRYFALSSKQSTNLASINSTQLKAFPVPLPPLSEQRRIASILSDGEGLVRKNEEMIGLKMAQKRVVACRVLTGGNRLKGFCGSWKIVRLNGISTRIREVASCPKQLPVLSITAGSGFVCQQDKFSRVIAGKQVENYVRLKRGEFSYNKGNSYRYPQGCVYQLTEFDEGLVPNVFYSFRLDEASADPEFIRQYFIAGLHNRDLCRWINSGVRNNGLLNLAASDFFNLPIKLPPLEEQQAIGRVLKDADEEIAALKAKHKVLMRQKRSLMQKLLTGQVRVSV